MGDVVDDLVNHEGTIRQSQGGVGGKDGVVGLNCGCGNSKRWVNTELHLGLLGIINRKMFHRQRGEPRAISRKPRSPEDLCTGQPLSKFGPRQGH